MNEAQKRRITATFQHVDGLLQSAVQALAEEGKDSPFQDLVLDATPIQHRVISDLVQQIRGRMKGALDRMGIGLHPATVPATRAALTNLMFAEVDLEDLDPKRMTGYGVLLEADAQALKEGCTDILSLLEQARAFLEARRASDLEARSAALAVPEVFQKVLRELARVITSHGLVSLRRPLEALLEAAEDPRFEVAVFGRVSSGKSSLINRILGQAVLPVGVTPVTALVTHLVHGPEARVKVQFAQAASRDIALEELPDYITEQGNPSNRKQVVSVQIALPHARLQRGVAFVDTPGVGSLAHAGAGETMAYLPRADLAILLTDATSALTPGDLLLLASLLKAGVRAMVVLSKADLLGPEDRKRVRDYVSAHLQADLGEAIPVHLVSAVGPEAALADQWFAEVLEPLLENHREERLRALARKAESLRVQVLGLLRRRLSQGAPDAPGTVPLEVAEVVLRKAATAPEQALADCRNLLRPLSAMADRLVDGLAEELLPQPGEALLPRLASRIEAPVGEVVRQVITCLEGCRMNLAAALEKAGSRPEANRDATPLPDPRDLPLFSGEELVRLADPIHLPRPWLPSGIRRLQARRFIRSHLAEALANALNAHRRRLDAWAQGYLSSLGQAFQTRASVLRAEWGAERPDEGPSSEGLARLQSDILTLEGLEGESL